jgi:hypothetical protein
MIKKIESYGGYIPIWYFVEQISLKQYSTS